MILHKDVNVDACWQNGDKEVPQTELAKPNITSNTNPDPACP